MLFDDIGRKRGSPQKTSSRAVETEIKSLGKSWREVKNMETLRNPWRFGVIEAKTNKLNAKFEYNGKYSF